MKTYINKFILLLVTTLLLCLLINYINPNIVYALEPDFIDENIKIEYNPTTIDNDWLIYHNEQDAYALNRKEINLYNDHSFRGEPVDYPIDLYFSDSSSNTTTEQLNTTIKQSKTVFYKSKIVWFTWKKYDGEFKSFKQFETWNKGQFSIRKQLKNDLLKAFSNKNK